jgi:hypothetical protein
MMTGLLKRKIPVAAHIRMPREFNRRNDMRKTVRSALCMFLLIIIFPFFLAAQGKSLSAANRKTAVRFLKLAEEYLTEKDWGRAHSQARMGIAYDDTVADLWYIEAAAESGLGKPRAEVLPLVTKALTEGQWVDYNRDGARILYSDLLCDTGGYAKAVDVIDAPPFIYSADAEYIRIKAYYRMNTPESVSKARNEVNGARKIYPDDTRFPRLFFRYEYAKKKDDVSSDVQSVADSFISRMPDYNSPDAELEIYAALFATGSKRVRMLQAFSAHNNEHPLYAGAALAAGLMTQQQALDYFFKFADKTISLSMLTSFVPLITEDAVKNSLIAHLNAYDGVLTVDTDGDLEPNLTVQYKRGRPQSLVWDKDNDGVHEWTAQCDFGTPVSVNLEAGKIVLYYGTYPAVVKAVFSENTGKFSNASFTLVDETFYWSPFEMKTLAQFKNDPGCDFFVPVVDLKITQPDADALHRASSGYEIPSQERGGSTIVFTMLDGQPQTADYYTGGISAQSADRKMYAHEVFKNGCPAMRSVDNDDDGIFETTETFGYDPSGEMQGTAPDNLQPDGNFSAKAGFYIKMIQIDEDGDTVPDFTEEYLPAGGKIASWDTDADGNWNVRYERYPQKDSKNILIEDASFYVPPENNLVTVTSVNGEPVKVSSGNFSYTVTKGVEDGLYWIGKEGTHEDEKDALAVLNRSSSQGMSVLVQTAKKRILAVRVENKSYLEILPEHDAIPESDTDKSNGPNN